MAKTIKEEDFELTKLVAKSQDKENDQKKETTFHLQAPQSKKTKSAIWSQTTKQKSEDAIKDPKYMKTRERYMSL